MGRRRRQPVPADPGRAGRAGRAGRSSGHNRARQQRLSSLATYAAYREWRFTPDGTGLESRFAGDPFGRGSRRTALNSIHGSYEGRAFVAFDYSYETSSGDNYTTHGLSVVAMHLGVPGVSVPPLQVSPQAGLGGFFNPSSATTS